MYAKKSFHNALQCSVSLEVSYLYCVQMAAVNLKLTKNM